MWLFVVASFVVPAIVAAGHTQASPQVPAAVSAPMSSPSDAEASTTPAGAELAAGPVGTCPFSCTSNAQCTTGCQTESICSNHRCFEL